ncbi:MAG: hypothetical protein ACAI38_10625 [Myxococcota bacterium]|nr:hypothetical protein [Myxococcota bacterium]
MSGLELALRITGASHLLLAIAHIPISRHLGWKADIETASLLTRQIFWVHCFFICLVLTMMGALGVYDPQTLIARSQLGLYVTGGITLFWAIRLVCQWFVYDSALWRGKRFETAMHVLFSAVWVLYVVVYGAAFRGQI